MGTPRIKSDTLDMLVRLHKSYPNKSPYIFGSMCAFGQGFEQLNFKIFKADEEMYIPGAMCINAEVLSGLANINFVAFINQYMSTRKPVLGQIGIHRGMAIIIMLSCLGYTFNNDTFPYIRNPDINQMWADLEQMSKGDHPVCTFLSIAVRGRSHNGFTKQHAERCKVTPVSILDVPIFDTRRPPVVMQPPVAPSGTTALPVSRQVQPPPPPPKTAMQPPPPPPRQKTTMQPPPPPPVSRQVQPMPPMQKIAMQPPPPPPRQKTTTQPPPPPPRQKTMMHPLPSPPTAAAASSDIIAPPPPTAAAASSDIIAPPASELPKSFAAAVML